MCLGPHQNEGRVWRREIGLSLLVKYYRRRTSVVDHLCFLCVFVSCVSHAFESVHCCLVVTCWERADLLALVGVVYCILLLFHVVSLVMCGT